MSFELVSRRLRLNELKRSDGPFIFSLFNDPDCLYYIGDRDIKTQQDALFYLNDRLIKSYKKHGFGLYKVTPKNSLEAMGICGLVKREENMPPDIGFAFLPHYRSNGFCTEAAQTILTWVEENNISNEILAYTKPDNKASIRVLEKIGMSKQSIRTLPGQDFESLILSVNFIL